LTLHPTVKPLVFLLCLLPFAALVWGVVQNTLGPDPGEAVMHMTGEWAGRILIATLLITPLRARPGWGQLIRLRRMLGLFAFFYATCHLTLFTHFFLGWDWLRVGEELVERPFITLGFTAWLLMLPLALTSNFAMQRRMKSTWRVLHRAVYLVAVLFVMHVIWLTRSDYGAALVYGLCVFLLLAWRVRARYQS
jgi:sulfoxide reductase heme-binding subunit YedZ